VYYQKEFFRKMITNYSFEGTSKSESSGYNGNPKTLNPLTKYFY